jgi:hypothetical protein
MKIWKEQAELVRKYKKWRADYRSARPAVRTLTRKRKKRTVRFVGAEERTLYRVRLKNPIGFVGPKGFDFVRKKLERATGIEPVSEAWEATVLPLY